MKRQNFNVTAEEEADIQRLREQLGAASVKEAVLRATRLVLLLADEVKEGGRLYIDEPGGARTRVLLPDMEGGRPVWKYLTSRPHSWKRQFFVKGRKLTAANVWYEMRSNMMTPEEAAENWDLPLEAVLEIIRYCESNRALIGMEADEEKRALQEAGVLKVSGAA